jgi:hypothetical protein
MDIDIYVIKTEYLKNRNRLLITTLDKLIKIMNDNNFKTNIINVLSPTMEDIENNINDYNKNINLNPDDIKDDDFKKNQTKFNFAQLSNLYKHRKAYEMIKNTKTKHNLIIEDDIILLDENMQNFKDFMKILNKIEYDILLTCVYHNNNKPKIDYLLSNINHKILSSKNSYFISTETASKLYDYLEIVRFPIKLSISKYIYDNKDKIKSYILNKCTLLDGSKLGIFPTSINGNNLLIQNSNFIELVNMLNNDEQDINKIENFYNKNGKDNSDYQHIMGIIYYKKKMYKKAIDILKSGVYNLKNNDGYIAQFTEILNNCINMHQFSQDDIKDCFTKEGIY